MIPANRRTPRPNGIDFTTEANSAPTSPQRLARAVAYALDAETAGQALDATTSLHELSVQALRHASFVQEALTHMREFEDAHGFEIEPDRILDTVGYLTGVAESLSDLAERLAESPVGQAVHLIKISAALEQARPPGPGEAPA